MQLRGGAPNARSRKSVAAFKNTLRIIVVLAFAHILPAQAEIDLIMSTNNLLLRANPSMKGM